MSAIAGIINFDGSPVAPGLIQGLTGIMASRGPHGRNHWQNGPVALGHCLLRNTPESTNDHQPLVSDIKQLTMVFDGRLDNRDELIRQLELSGEYRQRPDAEIVLQAYQRWHKDCPKHLLGDFAFAVWDQRRQQLFCARDHVGARPLCYIHNANYFAFASFDEALPSLPGVSSEPCEELLAHFLVPKFTDFKPDQTWLEDVRALLPAHTLTVAPGGEPVTEIYWQIELGEELNYSSDEEYEEAFIEVFTAAVRSRLRLEGEPAALISGGMDSAAIAATLGRLAPEMPGGRYHAYSTVADNPETSLESRCIMNMTGQPHVAAHYLNVPSFTGIVGQDDLLEAAWSQPHPVDNSIMLPAMMFLAASREGHHVMLHGAGGDITMDFHARYIAKYISRGHWRTAWAECKASAQNNTYLRGTSPYKLALLNAWTGLIPLWVRRCMRVFGKRSVGSGTGMGYLNPQFSEKLNLSKRMKPRNTPIIPGSREAHAHFAFGPHGVVSSSSGFQRMASRYGVELRDPWADRRVLEFFLHLPLEQQVRHGWTKYIARSAFRHELNERTLWRNDKEHLGWLFTQRLMNKSNDLVEHTLSEFPHAAYHYLNMDSIRELHRQYEQLKGPVVIQDVYDIMTLLMWIRRTYAGLHN